MKIKFYQKVSTTEYSVNCKQDIIYCIVQIITLIFLFIPQNCLALSKVPIKADSVDVKNCMDIQDYVERAINAHYIKDEKLLAEFWSVAVPDTSMRYQNLLLGKEFEIKRETYWYKSLRKIFKKEKRIRIVPIYVSITEHPYLKWIYGVSWNLEIKGKKYSDEDYMFMVWGFWNNNTPEILVSTWQPAYLDKEKTKRIDSKKLFSLGDFD